MRILKCPTCDEVKEVEFDSYIFGEEFSGLFINVEIPEGDVDKVDKDNFYPNKRDKNYFESLDTEELLERFKEYWHENECYDMGLKCSKCGSNLSHPLEEQ